MDLFLRKNDKMQGLFFTSKLDWASYIISISKTASKKIGAMICSTEFLSPEVSLICCHVWAGAPSCYLELLDKQQKWICKAVGTSFSASLEPVAHCRNVASVSLF